MAVACIVLDLLATMCLDTNMDTICSKSPMLRCSLTLLSQALAELCAG